jgi:excisionase family DNA binding protein
MAEAGGHRAYSIQEVATILQFHPDTVAYWLRTGELSGHRDEFANEWRIEPADLIAFLRQNGETLPSELAHVR